MSKEKKTIVEKLALTPVPRDQRQHWTSVTLIQAGMMVSVTSLWTGSLMVTGLTLVQSIIAGCIGYAIVVGLCCIQGFQGADLGVPSIQATTATFGDKGSQFLLTTIFILSMIGWFGINANICGEAFSGLMSESFGVDIPVQLSIIIWGIIMFSTSVIGFNGLKYLNIIAVPLMIVACVVGIYLGISQNGLNALSSFVPEGGMSFIGGINIVIGGYIVGAVTVADFTRYQRTRADVVKSSALGIFPAGVALLWAGAVLAIVAGTEDLTIIFISIGMPVFGLITLILSTWPANASNAYSAGIDTVKMLNLKDSKRPLLTAICGLVGTIVGSFQIIFYFETILTWFGIIMAPIIGVMVAEYWIIGKGKPENWHPTQGFNWIGIIALIIGVVVSILIPTGIPSINGTIISLLAYLILRKVMPEPKKLKTEIHEEV